MSLVGLFARDLFKGRTILVTGGGSGVNLGIARCFAELGANVALVGRTQSRLESAASELQRLGARVQVNAVDVRDYERLSLAVQDCVREFGSLDVLVCGAAGNFLSKAEEMSSAQFRAVVDIDLVGTFHAARAAFEPLKQSRGSALFISSGQASLPYAMQAHAGAAKAGVDNLMRNLALEWGAYGIRVNSIAPGPIRDTEGMRRLAPGRAAEVLAREIPLGRFGNAEEIGVAAAFLASPLGAYITGTVLSVDGGQNLPGSGPFTRAIHAAREEMLAGARR